VQRGPDWQWGDQDGGAGSRGITTSESKQPHWVGVTWAHGEPGQVCRCGAGGAYDLLVAGAACEDLLGTSSSSTPRASPMLFL
jgi:hypothetical protein